MRVPVNDRRDLPVGAGRIAVGLMALSVVVVTAAILILRNVGRASAPSNPPTQSDFLLLILAGVTPVSIVMAFVIRATSTAAARRRFESAQDRADRGARSDAGLDPDSLRRLGTAFTAQSIASAALIESIGLAGAVFYLLTGNPLTLAAVGVCLIIMTVFFPSQGRFEAFVRDITGQQRDPADRFDRG